MNITLKWMQIAVVGFACSSCVIPVQVPREPSQRQTAPTPVAGAVPAQAAPGPANQANAPQSNTQSSQGEIAVISVTSVAGLTGKHLAQFREIDDKLMDLVKKDLLNRGISVAAVQTTRQPYMLAVSVNKVDCGNNQNCQANAATVGASYVLKRYNSVLRSGKVEETSKPGWQKSAKKISEVIGGETAAGIVTGYTAYKASSTASPVAPRDEARIAVLSESKSTGLSGKRLKDFHEIDASLLKGIGKDLQDNGVGIAAPGSGAQRYVLSYKIDKLDCGPKDKCQANAIISASYVLKKDGAVLKSGKLEEQSKGALHKSVGKITERIAGDVAAAMGRR